MFCHKYLLWLIGLFHSILLLLEILLRIIFRCLLILPFNKIIGNREYDHCKYGC